MRELCKALNETTALLHRSFQLASKEAEKNKTNCQLALNLQWLQGQCTGRVASISLFFLISYSAFDNLLHYLQVATAKQSFCFPLNLSTLKSTAASINGEGTAECSGCLQHQIAFEVFLWVFCCRENADMCICGLVQLLGNISSCTTLQVDCLYIGS